jgi:hypothetical protein
MVRRLAVLLVCCAGCSLDEGGSPLASNPEAGAPDVFVDDVTTNDVTSNDVGTDVVEEPGPPLACTTDSGACSGTVPVGWALTAFAPNRATACPGNFTSADVVAAPSLQAGACTCSCAIQSQPSCEIGIVKTAWSNDSACGNPWTSHTIATAGQCMDYGMGSFQLGTHNSYTKLDLTAGKCTTAVVSDPNKVGATPMRTCTPPTACAEDVCNGTVPAGMRACITGAGNVTCPAGPFSDKVAVIGTNTTLGCAACSPCNVTQSACGNATVKYWSDANCTVAKGTIAADGVCNGTGSVTVSHFTYVNPVQNVQCVAGTSAPTADLASPRTVCCRL